MTLASRGVCIRSSARAAAPIKLSTQVPRKYDQCTQSSDCCRLGGLLDLLLVAVDFCTGSQKFIAQTETLADCCLQILCAGRHDAAADGFQQPLLQGAACWRRRLSERQKPAGRPCHCAMGASRGAVIQSASHYGYTREHARPRENTRTRTCYILLRGSSWRTVTSRRCKRMLRTRRCFLRTSALHT